MELRVVPKQDLVKYVCAVVGGILFEAYVPSVERSHKASKSLHHEDLHVTCKICFTDFTLNTQETQLFVVIYLVF